jgi:hypothetical protein
VFSRTREARLKKDNRRAAGAKRGYLTLTGKAGVYHPFIQLAVPLQVNAMAAQNWTRYIERSLEAEAGCGRF